MVCSLDLPAVAWPPEYFVDEYCLADAARVGQHGRELGGRCLARWLGWPSGGGKFVADKRADRVIEFRFELHVELRIFGDDPLAQFGRMCSEVFGTCRDLLGDVLRNAL